MRMHAAGFFKAAIVTNRGSHDRVFSICGGGGATTSIMEMSYK